MWKSVAAHLNMTPEDLEELIFQHEDLYFALQRRASLRYAMDHGVLASNHECHQLKDDNARISQRAADILGRFQGECAWIDLQYQKIEDARKEKEVRKLEAEARRAEAEAYARSDKRIKHEKCVDEWPNEHRDWFPPSPEGWLALGIYEYVLFSTSAELAADRDADFREQCMNRQIALPDSGPVPYWMRPEYANAGRRVVGWAPGDPKRFAHDILAVNKIPGEANLTDIIRKLDQLLRAGALEELKEQASREQDLASRERERPEEGDDNNTTGPPIPRDPKPPGDSGCGAADVCQGLKPLATSADPGGAEHSNDPGGVNERSQGFQPLAPVGAASPSPSPSPSHHDPLPPSPREADREERAANENVDHHRDPRSEEPQVRAGHDTQPPQVDGRVSQQKRQRNPHAKKPKPANQDRHARVPRAAKSRRKDDLARQGRHRHRYQPKYWYPRINHWLRSWFVTKEPKHRHRQDRERDAHRTHHEGGQTERRPPGPRGLRGPISAQILADERHRRRAERGAGEIPERLPLESDPVGRGGCGAEAIHDREKPQLAGRDRQAIHRGRDADAQQAPDERHVGHEIRPGEFEPRLPLRENDEQHDAADEVRRVPSRARCRQSRDRPTAPRRSRASTPGAR